MKIKFVIDSDEVIGGCWEGEFDVEKEDLYFVPTDDQIEDLYWEFIDKHVLDLINWYGTNFDEFKKWIKTINANAHSHKE